MSRKHYDNKTIAIFDTIGTYFVNVYYNHLYSKAADMVKQGVKKTITEAYKENIFNYQSGLKHHDRYTKTIVNLHEYYGQWTTYSAVVFADFQDKILSNFIPPEYYADFSNSEKDNTLYNIVIHTVSDLTSYITQPNIFNSIIDDHSNRDNVDAMQDEVVDILIIQREEYYNKFYEAKNKSQEVVSKVIFKKLKREYLVTKKKLSELEEDKLRAINIINGLMKKLQAAEKELKSVKENKSTNENKSINVQGSNKPDNDLGNQLTGVSIKSASNARYLNSKTPSVTGIVKTPTISTETAFTLESFSTDNVEDLQNKVDASSPLRDLATRDPDIGDHTSFATPTPTNVPTTPLNTTLNTPTTLLNTPTNISQDNGSSEESEDSDDINRRQEEELRRRVLARRPPQLDITNESVSDNAWLG